MCVRACVGNAHYNIDHEFQLFIIERYVPISTYTVYTS